MSAYATKVLHLLAVLLALGVSASLPLQASIAHRDDGANGSTNTLHWQSPAKLHRGLKAATGTLVFNSDGIEFHSDDPRVSHRWPYVEVKTFGLTSRRLVITDYENHSRHMPVPARHGTRFGGTNGTPQFRAEGIDYATSGGRGSRSWRWVDIQTLANPNPYQLRVGAYLGTFDFELKQPMSQDLFDRLWDHVYARDLNVGQTRGGEPHAEQ